MANSRWGLTKKNKVGPVAYWIREVEPKSVKDWEKSYYEKLESFLKEQGKSISAIEHLETLGKTLYIKVSEVLKKEIEEVKEEDCKNYIRELVINRTYDGYLREKKTIYQQLQDLLNVKIEVAPDEWDRRYNIDFYIKVNNRYMGLQIKPTTFEHAPDWARKWQELYKKSFEKFTKKYGGKVFILLSCSKGKDKIIYNMDIIDEIKKEIERLRLIK